MLKIIIISLISSFIVAEEAAKPQPLEVLKALSEFEKGAVNARKVYDTETIKLAGKALEQLEKAKLSYMQKGDLEGANLVSAAIKKLNEGEILTAIEENIKKKIEMVPNDINKIMGKWKSNGGFIREYSADGSVIHSNGDIGRWTINGNKFITTWNGNGVVDTLMLPIKSGTISGSNNKGASFTLTKVTVK